jgi:diguanylate cyclase (GGDEF)-like protein
VTWLLLGIWVGSASSGFQEGLRSMALPACIQPIENVETTGGQGIVLNPPFGCNGYRNWTMSPFRQKARTASTQPISVALRYVRRRELWLWSSSVMVMLLLTLGIASFAFPGLLTQVDAYYSFNLMQAVRGLVGLVLLFNVYTVYQQLQIRRMREELTAQIGALDRMEARTDEVFKLAILDPLTGLYNRRSGEQRLAEEVSRCKRHGLALTIMMLDLNRLKDVNDTCGHAAGDELIKYFAGRISKAIRGSDVAVRLGGDEFLLLLPECKPEEVSHVLGRLSDLKMVLEGREVSITFSAGSTDYKPGESPEEFLKRADQALYANKRSLKHQRGRELAVS